MELTYQGASDGVNVPLPSGAEPHIAHGGSYNFPDEYALTLLEQPENWRRTIPLAERIAKASARELDELALELGVTFDDGARTADKKAALEAASNPSAGASGRSSI